MNRDKAFDLARGLMGNIAGANEAQTRERILRLIDTEAISERAAALEEAAKVAETVAATLGEMYEGRKYGALHVATEIRALAKVQP